MYRCTALSPFGYLLAALTAGLSFSAGGEEAAARKAALNRRAEALPEAYRAVIHLFYHEGYSTAETAAI